MEEFSINRCYIKDERVFSEVRKIIADYDKEKIDIPGIELDDEVNLNDVIFLRNYLFHREIENEEWVSYAITWRTEHTQAYLVLLSMNGAINITYLFSRVVKYEINKFVQLEYEWLLDIKERFLRLEHDQDKARQCLLDYFKGLIKEAKLHRIEIPEIGALSLFFFNHDFYALDDRSKGFIEHEIEKLNEYFLGYTTNINSHKHTTTSHEPKNVQHEPPESPTESVADVLKGVRWKRNKADLAELIKGLYYVEAIEKDGNPIVLKDLKTIFEGVFDIEIGDLDKSFRSRLESNRNANNSLFLDQAGNRLDKMYREMAKEIRKKR